MLSITVRVVSAFSPRSPESRSARTFLHPKFKLLKHVPTVEPVIPLGTPGVELWAMARYGVGPEVGSNLRLLRGFGTGSFLWGMAYA